MRFRSILIAGLTGICAFPAFTARAQQVNQLPEWATEFADGIVFHDENKNQRFDSGERGLQGIRVSNGRQIVRTGEDGSYRIPVDDDTHIFVIKPRNWRTPIDEYMIPRFYYTHKPKGSPETKHPGVPPTGPLPDSVDFPLYPHPEPDTFKAVFWADPQPRNLEEIEYVTHDVIEELIGTDASFGVTLGDIMFDDLTLFEEQNARIALIGIPWYNVMGNHDTEQYEANDTITDEAFERVFGPTYYSFDHGPVHFIVLDDIIWYYDDGKQKVTYRGGLDANQLEFIRNDLALVPENQLVVLMMHIPLNRVGERGELYRLIEKRPFCISISGHTHYQEHVFIDSEDGWRGPKPHHHIINVTVSGSWWQGQKNELGIPHTTMRDGAPNGYSFITFDGTDYTFDYKAAGYPEDRQMHIHTPEEISSAEAIQTEVVVNVYAGSERSTVEMRFGDEGDWIALERAERPDPYFLEAREREAQDMAAYEAKGEKLPYRSLPGPRENVPHIWVGTLPANPQPGIHTIHVRTTDMFGRTFEDQRAIAVK